MNVIDYVKSRKGILGVEQLLGRIEEKRGEIKKEFKENEFYEYDLLLDYFEVVEELYGDQKNDIPRARDIGKQIAKNLGYYDYLLRAAGFKELINKAESGWNQVYDFGGIELVECHDNRAMIRYHGFPDNHNVCSYFQGSLEIDLEMLGLDGTVEHTACPVEGAEYIEFNITWQ